MEFTRKNAVVAAGLSAVLALTPVAVPASMAFADDQGAVQEQKGAGQEAEAANIVICNKKHFTVYFHNADGNLIDKVEGDAAFSLSNFAVLSPVKDYVNQLVSAHPEYSDASWTMFEPGSSNATPMDVENAKFGGTQPDYVNGGVGYYEINIYEFVSTPEKSTVTVSFDMNYPEGATGTSENYSVESSESGYITAPSDPACEGYEFLGWARNGNTDIPLLTSQAVGYQKYDLEEGDVTYVAQWKQIESEDPVEQINVTFEYDGTAVATVADENGNVDAAGLGLPENYTWSWTDSEGTVHEFGSDQLAGYIFTESCTVTGVAQEIEEPAQQLDVTFEFDNTTLATVAGEDGKISSDIVSQLPENYTWTWTDAQGTVHEFGSELLAGYIFTESCTVTGVANQAEEPADQIDVAFKFDNTTLATVAGEGGTISADTLKQLPGDYTWTWTDAQGTVHEFGSELLANYIFTESCTVTGVANQAEEPAAPREIKVNYYDGDQLLGTGSVFDGTSQWSGIVNPEKDGYTFLGWQFEGEDAIYTDAELDNVVYAADPTVTEINLYAQWEENAAEDPEAQYITVHFYDEFGTFLGDGAVLNGTSDWSGPIVAPELDGYTFIGWAEEGGSVYSPALLGQVVVSVPSNVTELTYIAHYEEVAPATETFKVTFDDCIAATENQVVEVENGQAVAKPADPTCEGWTFLGWFTDTALNQEYDFSAPVTSDMTLYAKWQQNEAVEPGTDDSTTTPAEPAAPAEENGDQAADEAADANDEQKLAQTGDNTMAVAGGVAAVAGVSAIAALGAALKRRFQ